MSKKNRIRIFIDTPLSVGHEIICPEETRHYLINVMRRQTGDDVFVFNGIDGEFQTKITSIDKKKCILKVESFFAPFNESPDIWLLFGLLKKDNTDLVIEKSVELGARKIIPVRSEYTTNSNVKIERLKAIAIEASEQSRRQDVPQIEDEIPLDNLLKNWSEDRKLIYLDETGNSENILKIMPKIGAPAAILIGPEGGFSQKELENLKKLPYTYGISLGKRILRAETAAIAALACWQAFSGDWNDNGDDK